MEFSSVLQKLHDRGALNQCKRRKHLPSMLQKLMMMVFADEGAELSRHRVLNAVFELCFGSSGK